MDYRRLLKVYMDSVRAYEGSTFIHALEDGPDKDELTRLGKELREEYAKRRYGGDANELS